MYFVIRRFANLPYEIELHDRCHDGKEEIEMHSLDGCPHILANPINTVPFPYTAVTSFSSQSFPRRNLSRNPSLISNPLDDYYVDNELGVYRIGLAVNDPSDGRPEGDRNYTVSNEDTHRRSNEAETDNVIDENFRDQTRNGQVANDSMNSRNRDRDRCGTEMTQEERSNLRIMENSRVPSSSSDDARRDHVYAHRSVHFQNFTEREGEVTLNVVQSNENNENTAGSSSRPIARHSREHRAEDPSQNEDDRSRAEEEDNNDFGALADIRESRV